MYTPGQTYTITIGVSGGVSGNGGGFSLEATQGSFANPGAFAQVSQGSVTHSSADARSWTVDWTAPGSGSGQVTIRLAVNTVDKGGTSAGDAWNTMQSIIQEDIPPNQPPSATDVTITPNGDVAYNEDLLLTYTYQDPDNDQESNSIIRWSLNGSHVSSMDGKTTILAADTTIGDVWTATVTPRDSQGNLGSEVQSATTATIVDIDSDNDGVFDSEDEFPNDPNETVDSDDDGVGDNGCLLYTSPSPRDQRGSRMPSSA